MSEKDDYEFVLPFLPLTSRGGSYNDEAFAAGFSLGKLCAELDNLIFDQDRDILTTLVPAADLIVLRHCCWLEVSTAEEVGYSHIRVVKAENAQS